MSRNARAAEPGKATAGATAAARRGFLVTGLRTLAGLLLWRADAARAASRPVGARLPASEREIARLGAAFARRDPRLAARLAREVEAELPSWLRWAGRTRRLRVARRLCLHPARIARELETDRVHSVDGWILARGEAALVAYVHAQGERAG